MTVFEQAPTAERPTAPRGADKILRFLPAESEITSQPAVLSEPTYLSSQHTIKYLVSMILVSRLRSARLRAERAQRECWRPLSWHLRGRALRWVRAV